MCDISPSSRSRSNEFENSFLEMLFKLLQISSSEINGVRWSIDKLVKIINVYQNIVRQSMWALYKAQSNTKNYNLKLTLIFYSYEYILYVINVFYIAT